MQYGDDIAGEFVSGEGVTITAGRPMLFSGVVIAANERCCGNTWPMNSTSICCLKSGPVRATGDATHCCEDRRGRSRVLYNDSYQVGL